MSKLLVKIKPYYHWFILIPLIISGVWFYVLEKKIIIPEYILHIRLDDYIPYIPVFVIPYILWYLYVAVPAVFLFFKAPGEFIRIAVFLTAGMVIAFSVYMIFPNGQTLRPELDLYDEPIIRLIRIIYSNDTPNNSAPSIHVIYSIAAHAAITFYNNNRNKVVWINRISFIIAVLCIISTVFIKQHSVIDLIFGIIVSVFLYYLIYVFGKEIAEKRKTNIVH
jgi:membrane-associated phospholipid phosphatase